MIDGRDQGGKKKRADSRVERELGGVGGDGTGLGEAIRIPNRRGKNNGDRVE